MTPEELEAIVAPLRAKTDLEVHQELGKLSLPAYARDRVLETLRKGRQRAAMNAVIEGDPTSVDGDVRDALNSMMKKFFDKKEARQ